MARSIVPPANRGARGRATAGARSAQQRVLAALAAAPLSIARHWDLLRQDLTFAARSARRNPGFTLVAVVTLALGIGAVTAIFTIVDAVVFRPLPFPDPGRLVHLDVTQHRPDRLGVVVFSYPQFEDVRDGSHAFQALAAWRRIGNLTLAADRGTLPAAYASAGFFRVLATAPVLGRAFTPRDEEAGAPPVAVITHRAWTRVFGSGPGILGQVLANAGDPPRPVTIVGVLPAGFDFPHPVFRSDVDAWLSVTPEVKTPPGAIPRSTKNWMVVGRLRAGVPLEAAANELDTIAARLAAAYPEAHGHEGLAVMFLHDRMVGRTRLPLLLFLGAVASLLLIACANVANLLLARASTRQREFGIRTALGAGRLRVVRQLLTESALLSLAGGAAGLALAWWAVRGFVAFSPRMPRLEEAGIDYRVLAFAFGVITLATLVAGLVPAARSSRRSVVEALTRASGSPGPGRWRLQPLGLLVSAELTLALVLLVGGGLMVTSFVHLLRADLGFDPRAVMAADLAGSPARPAARGGLTWAAALEQERGTGLAVLSDSQRSQAARDEELVRRIRALPGVASVGISTKAPFPEARGRSDVHIEGRPDTPGDTLMAETASASPGYFRALAIPLVAGRWFDERDRESAPRVAIVSETLARLGWPDGSALGQRIASGRGPWARVVGIVPDGLREGPTDTPAPELYFPDAQDPRPRTILIKMSAATTGLATAVEREVQAVDPGFHLGQVRLLEDALWERLTTPRFITSLLAAFSLLALVLALVGVHGVLAYSVVRRTREIGIRMALGGTRTRVMRLVLGQAARYAAVGLLAGLAGGVAVARVARALLFQVAPADPTTLVVVSLVLLVAVVLAAAGPARRATRVEPIACLKEE